MSSQTHVGSGTKRSYRSPRRERQALATRVAILGAAQSLFERQGYVATTIEAIAEQAEVSAKTVYLAFASKSALLRAVWDQALRGDHDDTPLAERAWYVALLDEADPRRQVALVASYSCSMKRRLAPLLHAVRSAAAGDPDCDELWRYIQDDFYRSQRRIIDAIALHGDFRPGLDTERAADIMWTLNHPDVWLLLTVERGWTPEQFEAWFTQTLTHQLVGDPPV